MTATNQQPVAEICSASHDDAQFGERAIKPLCDISGFEYGTPLYAGAAPAAVAPQGEEWRRPTTYLKRFGDAIALLCHGRRPEDQVLSSWLDGTSDVLQQFAVDNGPAWAQGIGLIDAATIAADQPTEGVAHEMRAAAAPALEAPAAPAAPNGWKLVPVKPTIAMLLAGDHARISTEHQTKPQAAYAAMLAAAPQAPSSDLALIIAALEHGQPQMAHYAEPCERHAQALAAARRMAAAPQAPAEAQEPVANLHDDGYWTPTKTEAGRALSDRLMFAGSPRIPVYTHPAPQAPDAPSYPTKFGPNDWVMDIAGVIVKLEEWEPGAVKAHTIYGKRHLPHQRLGWSTPDAADAFELAWRSRPVHLDRPTDKDLAKHWWQGGVDMAAPAAPVCEDCDDTGTVYDGKRVSFCAAGCAASVVERRADAAAPAAPAVDASDTALLDALAAESMDLRCFDMPTGQGDADVGWRVIQHHMGEPTERVVAEVYKDDPRSAIRAAIARLERDPYCTGALHEEAAAQAAAKGEHSHG